MAYRHSVEVLQHAWGNYRFFGNFYKIYGKKKKKKSIIHSASDNEKCILPTSFLPLWVDDMPVFFWPII